MTAYPRDTGVEGPREREQRLLDGLEWRIRQTLDMGCDLCGWGVPLVDAGGYFAHRTTRYPSGPERDCPMWMLHDALAEIEKYRRGQR